MKSYIYLLSLIIPLIGFYSGNKPKKLEYKNTTVILNVDDYICSEDQWVYVYGFKEWVSGNEETFFDSAFISKGQHHVEMNFKIPCAIGAELLFSKNGPVSLGFVAEQDSCIVLNIDESSPYNNINCCMEATQGSLNNFIYEKIVKERDNLSKKFEVYAEKEQTDSIKIQSHHFLNKLRSIMNETSEPIVALYCFYTIRYYIPNMNLKEVTPEFIAKFDWYHSLKEVCDYSFIIKTSEDAKKVEKRYAQLCNERNKCELLNKNLGERIDLNFEDADGKKISTNSISSTYVFVDFWASWCKPCRKEIPNIKQAVAKYKDELTIYAVSLDNKRDAWQKAIEEDSTQKFLQLIGTYRNGTPTKLLKQLDIKTIPANFLLDKDRRIIAKDLRGEQLVQTLDSLSKL